ncbi:hypothetical protein CMQ_8270 [Grosmannia clavigera kw1407]|uniref:Uncharacterized protein n=1 Tax=Grosmannia clavigera (strain kw1407 / UAMH 11150) TaxID=655863 RepID=F0XL18_GROCL|nr:uncharacterized protein CMQ_8270 [Grosmannia clavigera kw1407]EFX01804.1 hypothetical protein CMQ_8270 [Grosmannia clavigera kw1407]
MNRRSSKFAAQAAFNGPQHLLTYPHLGPEFAHWRTYQQLPSKVQQQFGHANSAAAPRPGEHDCVLSYMDAGNQDDLTFTQAVRERGWRDGKCDGGETGRMLRGDARTAS